MKLLLLVGDTQNSELDSLDELQLFFLCGRRSHHGPTKAFARG